MKIHIDFDSYFVSAERLKNPEYKNKPLVVVTGLNDDFFNEEVELNTRSLSFMKIVSLKDTSKSTNYNQHSTIISASYEAKALGVKSGDKVYEALLKVPNLVILRSDINFYRQLSQEISIYLSTQIPEIEQFSIDEFFGDLDGYIKDDEVYDFCKKLQANILNKFQIPVSIGASKGKWNAKLLTEKAKPFGVICKYNIDDILETTHIKDYVGIGKQMQKYLQAYGVDTLAKLLANKHLLVKFGKNGEKIYNRIIGNDKEELNSKKKQKSYSISKTFKSINDYELVIKRVGILAKYLAIKINVENTHPKSFTLDIKSNETSLHSTANLKQPFFEKDLINKSKELAKELLFTSKKSLNIYHIGLCANFISSDFTENIFELEQNKKEQNLKKTLNELRDRFGINCISFNKN